ncbi:hypothetical protein M378DRAFT_174304 [Amanita muscaria Koide BX008]|uniref:Uncharacterized protein n=1 Tax=Amanita muscaria (strain Koide BX008) TaxID=946122 RepID=A0A0C2SK72_AMAMK|nr:hypothetical protein M378DRAFT_174304 [Amanita muscaria Koide BX008]
MPDGLAVGMEGQTLTPTTAWPGTAMENVRHKRRERRYDGQVFGRMLDSIRSSLLLLCNYTSLSCPMLVDDISSLGRGMVSHVAPSPRGGEERGGRVQELTNVFAAKYIGPQTFSVI